MIYKHYKQRNQFKREVGKAMNKEDQRLFSKIYGCDMAGAIGNALGDKVEGKCWEYTEFHYGVLDTFVEGTERNSRVKHDDTYDQYRFAHKRPPARTEDGYERHKVCGNAVVRKGGHINVDDLTRSFVRQIDSTKFGYLLGWQDQFVYYSGRALSKARELGEYASWPGKIGTSKMIMPIGMINAGNPEKAYKEAVDCARIKDAPGADWNHGVECAGLIAAGVAEALKPEATYESVIDVVLSMASDKLRAEINWLLDYAKKAKDWRELRIPYNARYDGLNISMANEILTAGIACFYLAKGDPKEAIIISSNIGRDTDCKAYVAGGFAGALKGYEAMPKEWIEPVEADTEINEMTLNRQTCWERAHAFYRIVMKDRGIKIPEYEKSIDGILKEKLNKTTLIEADYKAIISLDAGNRGLTSLEGIQKLVNLEWLKFDVNEVSDISLLRGMTKLVHLDFGCNKVSDISVLEGMKNLKCLIMYDNEVKDISPLKGLTGIEFLNMDNNRIEDLSALEGFSSLHALLLENNKVSDISPIGKNAGLCSLGLSGNSVSDLSALAGMKNLIALYIRNNKVSDVSPLINLRKTLKCLIIDSNKIQDGSSIGRLERLIHLNISNNPMKDLSFIEELSCLMSLDVDGMGLSSVIIPASLKHLGASGNNISDISFLSGASKLHYLDMSNNKVSDVSLIGKLSGLKYLYLKGNPAKDYSALEKLQSIEEKEF